MFHTSCQLFSKTMRVEQFESLFFEFPGKKYVTENVATQITKLLHRFECTIPSLKGQYKHSWQH